MEKESLEDILAECEKVIKQIWRAIGNGKNGEMSRKPLSKKRKFEETSDNTNEIKSKVAKF